MSPTLLPVEPAPRLAISLFIEVACSRGCRCSLIQKRSHGWVECRHAAQQRVNALAPRTQINHFGNVNKMVGSGAPGDLMC